MNTLMCVIKINIIGVAEGMEGEDETQRQIDSKMRKCMNNDNRQRRKKDNYRNFNRQEMASN